MANTLRPSGSLQITTPGGTRQVGSNLSITPAGTKTFCDMQTVGTAAATMAIGSCASLSYVSLLNLPANTATVTVSCAPMVLKPGYVAIFPPSTTLITLQATAAATDIDTAGGEA